MKYFSKIIQVLAILLVLFSCERKEEYSVFYDISGNVMDDRGRIAVHSNIYLDDELKTTTDSEGDFIIPEIRAGQYTIKATFSDSTTGFSEAEMEVDLKGGDLVLETLLLPVPVRLFKPDSVSSTSITLAWSKCSASDFREYKVYIHYSGALDESTGTLLNIATDVNDTTLKISEGDFWWGGSTLSPDTEYYFRVFVMNAYGRMSGSNILGVRTSLWDHPEEFTRNYILDLEGAFATQGDLTGIAWDGTYFWMLYFEELGGINDHNRLTLVQYDHQQGQTLRSVLFEDSNDYPEGITWDGHDIWISFGSCIKSVDLENETWDRIFCAGEVTVDLAWDEEELLLLDVWNKVISIHPENGMIGREFETPFKRIGYSGEKGIACREDEIWIINNWHHELCILNQSGKHIGVAEVDFLQDGLISNGFRMPMCFMGDKLVIAFNSQLRIYTIESTE